MNFSEFDNTRVRMIEILGVTDIFMIYFPMFS